MPLIFISCLIKALLRIKGYVSGLRPSSYPYMQGRALIKHKINTSSIIYIILQGHTMQIVPVVFILDFIYALPAYNDLMRPYNLRSAWIKTKTNTERIIWFLSLPTTSQLCLINPLHVVLYLYTADLKLK